MSELPSWFSRVRAVWATIGSLLVLLGFTSPEWLPEIFSQAFIDKVAVLLGSVLTFAQYIRSIFAKEAADLIAKATSSSKMAYLNPFKLRV